MRNDSLGDAGTNPFSIESHKMANHIIKNGLTYVSEFYGQKFHYIIQSFGLEPLIVLHCIKVIWQFATSNKLTSQKNWNGLKTILYKSVHMRYAMISYMIQT